jgi:pimeloyl-ACP methyl ester carboxylesterase
MQGTHATGHTHFLDIEGGRIAYDDTGDGFPIIAIPGMGDLRAQYRHLLPAIQQAGYRVITMDVRGFGESSAEWTDYSARAVGRDALELLKHLNTGPAVILGNSFAAGSALWAASDAPELIRGVALLGPIVRDLPVSPTTMLALQVGLGGPWQVEFWTRYVDALFPARKPDDHASYKAALAANLREPRRMEALLAMLALSKAETAKMLPNSRVPALVVMGSRDPDFDDPAAEASWVSCQIGGEPFMIEAAGHYPHAEMPEQVAPRLIAFVQGLTA